MAPQNIFGKFFFSYELMSLFRVYVLEQQKFTQKYFFLENNMRSSKSIIVSIAIHLAIFSLSFTIFVGQKQKNDQPLSYTYTIQTHVARTTQLRNNLRMTPRVFEPQIQDPQNPPVDITQQKDDFDQPLTKREVRPIKSYEKFGTERLTPKKPKTTSRKNTAKTNNRLTSKKSQTTPRNHTAKASKPAKTKNNSKATAKSSQKNTKKTAQSAQTGKNEKSQKSASISRNTAQSNAKIERPRLRKKFAINYPQAAKRLRLSGSLMLKIQILKNGRVGEIEVLRGSGMHILDKAAIESVKTWLFYPATKNDVPVNSRIKVPITFKL